MDTHPIDLDQLPTSSNTNAARPSVVFDTETTGLPTGRGPYWNTAIYNSCRIVSISWIASDTGSHPIYYIVKPDGFVSSPESIAIHGITHDIAMNTGVPFTDIMNHFFHDLERMGSQTLLVAHNLPVELGIAKRSGPRLGFQLAARFFGALALGLLLHGVYDATGLLQEPAQVLLAPRQEAATREAVL